jgi:Methyltransferase domain
MRLKKLLRRILLRHIERNESFEKRLLYLLKDACPTKFIWLDYPVCPKPRYTSARPHPILYQIVNASRAEYEKRLLSFLQYRVKLSQIHLNADPEAPFEPCWHNDFLTGLDAISLYSFLATNNPKRYVEIGSGSSTKFARRAIADCNLRTTITSIDPNPRSQIDEICDHRISITLEDCDLGFFGELEAGDVLFVDGSHRVFTNSDCTVMFLEILPRLCSGVLVQFHDICLPYDYPPDWSNRFYSEQYLLAAYLLARADFLEVVLPNAFISYDEHLRQILSPIWTDPLLQEIQVGGGSFWVKTS